MYSLSRVVLVAAGLALAPVTLLAAESVANQAQALLNQDQAAEALSLLESHLRKNPQDAEARFTQGLALVNLGRNDDAIRVFADLTRDYPQLPEPFNNLAVLYAADGDYEKARDALEAALATHPSYATAHENLGDIYAALAGAAYNRALQLDNANQTLRRKLALIDDLDSVSVAVPVAPKPTLAPSPTPPPAVALEMPGLTPSAAMPAAEAAAPAPAPAPTLSTVDRNAINTAVDAWREAWSAQDLSAYFAVYDTDFVPEGGLSRTAWEAQRRDRISGPNSISVEVTDLQATATGAETATVKFGQRYESDSFSDAVDKMLDMKRTAGGWKITREYTR